MGVIVSNPLRVACNTSTGNQTLTFTWTDGNSYTPKAVILIAVRGVTDGTAVDEAGIYWGMSDGTNEATGSYESQHAQAAVDAQSTQDTTADRILSIYDASANAAIDATADFVSFGSDQLTINWTNAPAAAFLLEAIAFSGTDLTAKVGSQDLGGISNALIANTSVGFEADLVFSFWNNQVDSGQISLGFIHNNRAGTVTQRVVAHQNRSTFGTSATVATVRDDVGIAKIIPSTAALDIGGTFQSFDSQGWDVQLTNNRSPGNADYSYLALRLGSSPVVSSKVYTYSTPTSTGSNTDSNPNFQPQFVMYVANRVATVNTVETDADAGTFGIVAASASAVYSQTISDEDAVGDTNTQSMSDDKLNLPNHSGGTGHEATLTSMGSTGAVWNWSATDSTARLWIALAIEAAGNNTNGTLTKTLDAITASSTGTIDIQGSVSKTLGNTTSSATGTIDKSGSVSATLANVTSSSTGAIDIQGTLSKTLNDATLSATGVLASEISGELSVTLGNVTSSASSQLDVSGSLSKTLSGVTASSAGSIDIVGSLSKALDGATSSATGTLDNSGLLSKTLDAITSSSTGQLGIAGSLSKTLDDVSGNSAGILALSGSLNKSLDNIASSGTSMLFNAGSTNQTLENVSLSSTGALEIIVTSENTLEDITSSATGTSTLSGSSNATLANVSSTSTATLANTGSLSQTLEDIQLTSEGGSAPTAQLTSTLQDVTASSTGVISIAASVSATLQNVSSSSAGTISITGSLSKTLDNISTTSAQTTLQINASLNKALEDVSLSAQGATLNAPSEGVVNVTLQNVTVVTTGTVGIGGNTGGMLDSVTVTAQGALIIVGSSDAVLSDITGSGGAATEIKGMFVNTLENVSLTSVGFMGTGRVAQLNVTLEGISVLSSGTAFDRLLYESIAFITTQISDRTVMVAQKNETAMITKTIETSTKIS